jgi:hypothetical protein
MTNAVRQKQIRPAGRGVTPVSLMLPRSTLRRARRALLSTCPFLALNRHMGGRAPATAADAVAGPAMQWSAQRPVNWFEFQSAAYAPAADVSKPEPGHGRSPGDKAVGASSLDASPGATLLPSKLSSLALIGTARGKTAFKDWRVQPWAGRVNGLSPAVPEHRRTPAGAGASAETRSKAGAARSPAPAAVQPSLSSERPAPHKPQTGSIVNRIAEILTPGPAADPEAPRDTGGKSQPARRRQSGKEEATQAATPGESGRTRPPSPALSHLPGLKSVVHHIPALMMAPGLRPAGDWAPVSTAVSGRGKGPSMPQSVWRARPGLQVRAGSGLIDVLEKRMQAWTSSIIEKRVQQTIDANGANQNHDSGNRGNTAVEVNDSVARAVLRRIRELADEERFRSGRLR